MRPSSSNVRQSPLAGVSRHPHPTLIRKTAATSAGPRRVPATAALPVATSAQTFPKVDPWICDLSSNSSCFVVIHVHDENNKVSKDFFCNRSVLLREMRYFRCYVSEMGVDNDEYDISVHCDSTVFLWLVEYVHAPMRNQPTPALENAMAVSALISADFLQMTTVVPEILGYIHNHVGEIVRLPISLKSIRRPLLQKLSTFFSNASLLLMRDRKDKLGSTIHLYTIKELLTKRKGLLRCRYCGKLYTADALIMTCAGAPLEVNFRGVLQGTHSPDPSWQVATYIMHLHRLGVMWCQIYWRLWALVNADHCATCHKPFMYADLNYGCNDGTAHTLTRAQPAEQELIRHVVERHPDTQIPGNRDCINLVANNCDVVPVQPGESMQQPARFTSSTVLATTRTHRTPRVDLIRENDGIRMADLLRLLERSRDDVLDTFLPGQASNANATTTPSKWGSGQGGLLTSPSCNTRGRQNLSMMARRGAAKY